jgi:hypothetical protein
MRYKYVNIFENDALPHSIESLNKARDAPQESLQSTEWRKLRRSPGRSVNKTFYLMHILYVVLMLKHIVTCSWLRD